MKFEHLFGKSDEELAADGVTRLIAEEAAPCRVTLEDAIPGESVLLLNYEHLAGSSSYRSSGPIFVREGAHPTALIDHIPAEMRSRLYSVRAYDGNDWMIDADVALGSDLEQIIGRFFTNEKAAYLHLHHARRGCYACRVDRL